MCAQVRKIVSSAYQRTIELLTGKRNLVQALAEKLLEKEVWPTGWLGAQCEKCMCLVAKAEQECMLHCKLEMSAAEVQ